MSGADICEFIEARLAEDAKRWQTIWRFKAGDKRIDGWWDLGGTLGYAVSDIIDTTRGGRDIAAKRAILALHMRGYAEFEDGTRIPFCEDRSADPDFNGDLWAPCLTARLLAAPYADHEDFAPAWSVTR